jgi:hypothetical protein
LLYPHGNLSVGGFLDILHVASVTKSFIISESLSDETHP